MRSWCTMLALLGLVVFLLTTAVSAADFRFETRRYEGDAEEPYSESVTLFHEHRVYDFVDNAEEIRVFTSTAGGEAGMFVLLDTKHRLRSEIPTREIVGFMDATRRWARQQEDDPLSLFAADPKFEEAFEKNRTGEGGQLTLKSEVVNFEIRTVQAKDSDRLRAFHQFSDWSAQLHVLRNVGSTPPFPRLAASRAMRAQGVVPAEIRCTIAERKSKRPKEIVVRATHDIRWRLSKQDRDRIEQVHQQLVDYRLVPYDQFRSLAEKPADESTTR